MLGKEIHVSTPQRKHWHIVIVLAVCMIAAVPSGADDAASGLVDSQTFLRRNLTPAGPPASASAAAVEKLLSQMTLKEKIGQMTQLEIGMSVMERISPFESMLRNCTKPWANTVWVPSST